MFATMTRKNVINFFYLIPNNRQMTTAYVNVRRNQMIVGFILFSFGFFDYYIFNDVYFRRKGINEVRLS